MKRILLPLNFLFYIPSCLQAQDMLSDRLDVLETKLKETKEEVHLLKRLFGPHA